MKYFNGVFNLYLNCVKNYKRIVETVIYYHIYKIRNVFILLVKKSEQLIYCDFIDGNQQEREAILVKKYASKVTQSPMEFTSEIELLNDYFSENKAIDYSAELPKGTDFQESVWAELIKIPYGETRAYSDIAEAIGSPSAVRAVASAVARNPLLIFIPCHRVIQKSGKTGKYRSGEEVKKWLLKHEEGIIEVE